MFSSEKRKKELQRSQRNYRRHLKEIERKDKKHQISKREAKIYRHLLKHQNETYSVRKESYFEKYGSFINPGSGSLILEIPKSFCLCLNYSQSMAFIKEFASSMYDYIGFEITLDFSKCEKADTAALFLLQIIRIEIENIIVKMASIFTVLNLQTGIKLNISKKPDVVRLLITTGYPVDIKKFNSENNEVVVMQPIDDMGLFKGNARQQHIRENRKPVVTNRVVQYLNKCLDRHGYELTEDDKNSVGGIIGEVLSNCEDHSMSDAWYITANFSMDLKDSSHDAMVGELNITIMNFGLSFFEAFEKTKENNHHIYKTVRDLAAIPRANYPEMKFGNEQMFTLIMMSETVSRLKYQEKSRGTGTMKFLQSFIELGDFEDKANGYSPTLSLITGKTQLTCDKDLKPFLKDNVYCLSLNPEMDLRLPPRESHLKILNEKFPGTMLSVKIYLNKQHLDKKYGGNNHES